MNTPNHTEATAREVPDSAELADLVDEIEQRIANGQAVDIDDYAKRFPNIADPLRAAHASLVSIRHMFADIDAQTALDVGGETGRLGDFRLVGELGRGGMGVVFEAEQISLGRQVAIKVLPFAALLDQRQLERFKNEARAAAMLKHPNIVSVYSVGCERGIHFYAMELVRGQSLAELIASWNKESERPLGPHNVDNSHSESSCDDKSRSAESSSDRAASADTCPIAALSTRNTNNRKSFYRGVASLGVRVAEALDYAHQMGVIHRDIKPSNLLLDQDGHVQITDFGLARIQASDALTMTGDVLGTLRYMSPEQLERGIVVDQRTDVYSLGLTLFELIAGEPAFRGVGRHELTAQILEATPRFPSRIRPHVPRDLETIIGKATDKDPSCRYATAADMAADLQRFLNQKPITARRTGWVERTRRWAGRNRALALSLATVSFLLVLLAAGSTSIAWKLSTEAERNQFAMYARDMRLAQTALGNGDRLAVEKALLAWVPDKGRDDLRDFEWYYLWNSCHHPAIERTISHQLYAFAVEFVSDDSKQLAVGWFNDYVNIWDWHNTAKTSPIHSFPNKVMGVRELLRVPEHNRLVCGDSDGRVIIWDLKTRQQVGPTITPVLPAGIGRNVCSLSVHPDGNLLAVGYGGTGGGCVRVWDIPDNKWIANLNDYPGICRSVFVDRERLAVASERSGTLEVWNVGTWQQQAKYDLSVDGVTAIAFSSKRRELAVATRISSDTRTHSSVSIWNVDTWQPIQRCALHNGHVECVTYSRDGRFLATVGTDQSMTLVDLADDRALVVEAAHAGTICSVAFAPNGEYLATAGRDNQVRIWNVSKLLNEPLSSDVSPQNDSLSGQASSVFADDGTIVATSRYDGEVSLWDSRDGRTVHEFNIDWPEWLIQLAVSRQRSLIAVTCGHFPEKPLPAKVEVWSLQEKRRLYTYELPHGVLYSMSSFSPDGRFLAVCCKTHVTIIDVERQETHCDIDFNATIKDVEFSPDGKWLACANWRAGTVHLVDTSDFVERRKPIKVDSLACECVAFSPNSQVVAVGGLDKRVKLLDVFTGSVIGEFDECPSYIVKIDFSPSGERIVSASADGQVSIWNAHTGDRLLEFDFPRGGYPKPEFSADGQSLLVGDLGAIKVLRATEVGKLSQMSIVELNDIACQNTIEH